MINFTDVKKVLNSITWNYQPLSNLKPDLSNENIASFYQFTANTKCGTIKFTCHNIAGCARLS